MKILIPFLLISFFFFACNKKEENQYDKIYISSELQSQEFKIGSYWIFRNDSTLAIDCSYVWNVAHGFNDQYWGLNRFTSTEYYSVVYYNSKTINGYPYDLDRMEGCFLMHNPVITYNNSWVGPVNYSCVRDSITIYSDSLRVGNNIFYKVQKATIGITDFYSAKSIGYIKKIIRDSINRGTWNLIKWKTNK